MDLREFDDILKNKLEQIPAENHSVPDWDRMNRQLDEDSLKDQMFDEQVSRKLEQLSIHQFAKPSWNSLYELIDRRIQNKRKVLYSKSFELLTVLLLLLTVHNLGFLENSNKNSLDQENSTIAPLIAQEYKVENNSSQIFELDEIENSPQRAVVTKEPAQDLSYSAVSQRTELARLDDVEVNSAIVSSSVDSQVAEDKVLEARTQLYASTQIPFAKPIEHIDFEDVAAEFAAVPSMSIRHTSDISSEIMKEVFARDFPELQIKGLETQNVEMMALAEVPSIKMQSRKNSKWFITAEVGNNFHEVISSVHQSVSNSRAPSVTGNLSSTRNTASQVGNLRVGYSIGLLEIVTGAGYERIKYNPGLILQTGQLTSKIKQTELSNIQYDFLNIPLDLNWNVVKYGSWNMQFHSGILANVLLRAKESVTQTIYSGTRVTEVAPQNIDHSVFNFDFQRGYFDDSVAEEDEVSVSNALNFKTRLGLSIGKKINRRTSIFGRTDYIYQLPYSFLQQGHENTDRINTLSFTMGIKQFLG